MSENILSKIVEAKKIEVEERKNKTPLNALKSSALFSRPTISLQKKVNELDHFIIAEFKRKSPSKGIINQEKNAVDVAKMYASCGASAISVLTDTLFFGGSTEDLLEVRKHVSVPILRKDFIIDPYQIFEARSMGADMILIIAAITPKQKIEELTLQAQALGLEVLLELHGDDEVDLICPQVNFVGVNNRNLKNFEVNLTHSQRLLKDIAEHHITIAESGIASISDAQFLFQSGYKGILVGEYLMKSNHICEDIEHILHVPKS